MTMENPGLLYVIATMLPLVSFVVLFLGGRRWGKAGAYVATAAIVGAFVLSAIGFVKYITHHDESHAPAAHAKPAHADKEHKADEKAHPPAVHGGLAHHEPLVWRGSIYWAVLGNRTASEPGVSLKLGYYIDSLAATMFVMITLIASLIHIFSIGYMADEQQESVEDHQAHVTRRGRFSRFFMFLSLFCFSMLNLVLADNLFQIFLSWELVGICSYLLIGFYYERKSASNAANKAFITNRIGDMGFIIGLMILWTYVGTLNFHTSYGPVHDDTGAVVKDEHGKPQMEIKEIGIFDVLRSPVKDDDDEVMPMPGQITRVSTYERGGKEYWKADPAGDHALLFTTKFRDHFHATDFKGVEGGHAHPAKYYPAIPYWLLVLAGIGVFLGCVGKSAQFPLHVWLPDAMEGPTPVSALIHAATMVAAGVYLVGRAFPLFTAEVLLVIAYTGGITLFVAATIAIVQTDIKKVLAYSTVSQLGFMMLALGVGGWAAGLFHLITHAFFKALLFLGSGSVIYGCHHEQEMTKMGGLYPKMKFTALTMLVGVLAIAGTPLFSGWYSKDAILVSSLSFVSLNPTHSLLFILPLVTAGITGFYMFRLWFMTFTGKPRDAYMHEHAHESPWVMTMPLIVLAFFSIVVAWGLPPWDVQASYLEHQLLHSSQPASLSVDEAMSLKAANDQVHRNDFVKDSIFANVYTRSNLGPHNLAGILALLSAGIGVALAFVVYYWRLLDAADTKAQFARIHSFLWHKWRFDELYSALIVRPSLVIAHWGRWFDTHVIDGLVNWLGRFTTRVSSWEGKFDLGIVDGLVNVTGNVVFAVGAWLRVFQTGLIRNYILFLAVAAVGIFAVLSYVVALAG